jgi:hypothetical protein
MPKCDKKWKASSGELSSQLDVAEPRLKPLLVPQYSGEGTLAQSLRSPPCPLSRYAGPQSHYLGR